MAQRFDVIVVGSGFGGSVAACRLAQAGASVLVLERGRRWTRAEYPRHAGDPWIYDHAHPGKHHGWLDLRTYRGMTVALGAGVGGGSLCYSSVVMEADERCFAAGWPPEITLAELEPHYAKARVMLRAATIPAGQTTKRQQLLGHAARKVGYGDRFGPVPLAIAFDEDWNYDLPDPLDVRHSRTFTNDQGVSQGTCVHLGNCDIGCDVHAKNTLDLNYIPAAERHGAQVRPLHVVRAIEPEPGGYKVTFDRISGDVLVRGEERAARVVLAAGSLGSTELLLRCRDQYATLPRVSRALGAGWSANANYFSSGTYGPEVEVQQSIGPTIASGIDLMDGAVNNERIFIEDDGFPNMLLNVLTHKLRSGRVNSLAWAFQSHLRRGVDEKNPMRNVMLWLGEGVDASDGALRLGRAPLAPWRKELRLRWSPSASRPALDAIESTHRQLTEATGGRFRAPVYWTLLRHLATVHPLGGCRVGVSAADAVVDHRGEVFGHPGLFVADGAAIPHAIGRNPSLTIAAFAERSAALMAS